MIKSKLKIFVSCYLLSVTGLIFSQNIPNPVLPYIADIGVMKYNGKYYLIGTRTCGGMYYTSDLVKWEGPIQAITMDNEWTRGTGANSCQINASDLIYLEGVFHLYWSVDYWGRDRHIVRITHAEATDPLGQYVEPNKETWMDNRIDIQVFRDDDGKLYMYMVRFTDGNTIWVRPMNDPRTPALPLIYQFASLPNTWERMDNSVAEGPWVIKYRDLYYMMYNGNHTGTGWGNYQLGVAVAESPITFNHGNKYCYPLLLSNQTILEEKYEDILLFNNGYETQFSYSEEVPAGKWTDISFDDSSWKKGRPGFSSAKIEGSTMRKQRTEWTSDKLFTRKIFTVDKNEIGNLALRVHNDSAVKVFLNNELIFERTRQDHIIENLDPEKINKILVNGANILAVETVKRPRGGFLDISLFDLKDEIADDILYSPGQPNILRGLNGFEWWLIYMANKNREPRSQYINRIHFFGKTMYADNVTSTNTKGYFPTPTEATYRDVFDDNSKLGKWTFQDKTWTVSDGEMISETNSNALLNNSLKANSYLFEAGINTTTKAGVFAWWLDKSNWVKIGIDAPNSTWYIQQCLKGKITTTSKPMFEGFKSGVYHTINVERDYNRIKVRIDNLTVTPELIVIDFMTGESVPGLFSENGTAKFDGIIFTKGWDEFDKNITNWGNSNSGDKKQGNFKITDSGLKVESKQPFQAFKGDYLQNYEFSIQVENVSNDGIAGIYPLYIDKNNYVVAGFNSNTKQLDVKAVKDGITVFNQTISLENLKTHYADAKYTDQFEKGYTFNHPTWINEIWLNRVPVDNDNLFIDNMFDKFNIEYLKDGKWHKFNNVNTKIDNNRMYNSMTFNPVKAESLRFTNSEASRHDGTIYRGSYIYKIRVNELFSDSFNFRFVKRDNFMLILVDGREICKLEIEFPAAQIGIFSEDCQPVYNGVLRYDVPE